MLRIAYWGHVINMSVTLLSSFFIFGKSINHHKVFKYIIFAVLWCSLWAFLYASLPPWIPALIVRPILCLVSIIFIRIMLKIKLDTVISAFLLSYGISYAFLYISGLLIGFVFIPFLGVGFDPSSLVDYDEPIYLLMFTLTAALQLLFAYLFFRIRRFKKGFPFLLERYAVILALIVTGIVMSIVSLLTTRDSYDNNTLYLFIAGVLIIGAGIIIWIRRGISMFQWRKIMLRNIELLEHALADEKEKNKRLTEKFEIARSANHKILHRLEAMELRVARQTGNAEFGEEFVTTEDILKFQNEYQADVARIKGKKPLPSTKIKEIDYLFEHFAAKFADNKIDFNLKINGSIPYMVESIIQQSKLETMIGDHLQDALAAVNASDNSFRSVFAGIGLAGDCYEFTVSDSGIPFEADTLVRLGTECVTTHADTGGSGTGFMTTFETMRECDASLIINEKQPSTADYTKSVTIRFDGRARYIIETYRPNEFPSNDRYEIVDRRR